MADLTPERQTIDETPSLTKSNTNDKDTHQTSDSSSDLEYSSCEDLLTIRERKGLSSGRTNKKQAESPPRKRAKPRYVLAGWRAKRVQF